MASALQSVVKSIQINNYVTLMVLIAFGYDYILTFSDEIAYIWSRPWTRISTLFVLARYLGMCNVIIKAILGSSFLPGPVKVIPHSPDEDTLFDYIRRRILYVLSTWAELGFIGAADLSMILRVWALYRRSKFILGTLLALYAFEIVSNLVWYITISIENERIVDTAQVLDFSFCVVQDENPVRIWIANTGQIALGALMCLLLVIRFLREALQSYKATKRFRLNRYMSSFVREGMAYFLAMLVTSLLNILFNATNFPQTGWWILLSVVQLVPPYTLIPRFILNLRALYERDLQGRRGSDVDSAFGLSPGFVNSAATSTIMFSDGEQNERSEQGEEIQMIEMAGEDRGAGSNSTRTLSG